MKLKLISIITSLTLLTSPLYAQLVTIGDDKVKFKGFQDVKKDKLEDGAHSRFENVYVTREGMVRNVKGRNRLNSSANADTVVNMFCYYENAAGTMKRYLVRESDEVVTYTTAWGSRTSIASGLANEAGSCIQIGDTLYFTSDTDGLYKWTGSGSAAAVGSVSAPSSVDFSATTGVGGLTPGLDAIMKSKYQAATVSSTGSLFLSTGGCIAGPATTTQTCDVNSKTGVLCTAESSCSAGCSGGVLATNFCPDSWSKECATTSTYQYKVTKYSSIWGIESEASTADSATLSGNNTFDTSVQEPFLTTSSSTVCGSASTNYADNVAVPTGVAETKTTGTLASAPSAPFDSYRVYRTVAGGSDFFLLGFQTTGAYPDGKPDISLGPALDTTIDHITPPTYKYVAGYKGHLFLAQGTLLYFTHLPVGVVTSADTYWLETDKIDIGGGKDITGMIGLEDRLLIFTSDRVIQLSGFGITSFRLRTILSGFGTVNHNTVEVDNNGDVIFFAGTQGVYKLAVGRQRTDDANGTVIDQPEQVLRVTSPWLDNVFNTQNTTVGLSAANYTSAHSYYDVDNDLYFLYISSDGFIYNNLNNSWTHTPATQFLASVYRKSPNGAGQGSMVDNLGFAYDNWIGYENGIESGTVTGTATSSTSTTLTDSTATFNTTNDGLKGLWVFLDNVNGEWRQVSSNTGTALTVSSAWTTNPIAGDSYYVAYIIPQWKTKQYSFTRAPERQQIKNMWVINNNAPATQTLEVYVYVNKDTSAINVTTANLRVTTNLQAKVQNKLNIPSGGNGIIGNWFELGFRSFIYNTSTTVDAPIDIVNYVIDFDVLPER